MVLRFDGYSRDWAAAQPGLIVLWEYVRSRWPTAEFLGIHAARNMRGTTTRSLHAEGRALDARLPSRQALDDLIGFLIAHADRLNVQAINDYPRRLRWRPDRGWYPNSSPSPGGNAIHVERNWDGALDARPIAHIIGGALVAKGAAMKVTATCAVPWLAPVKGRIPQVRAELHADGTTKVVGYACKVEGGRVAYGLSVRDLGRLNAPIVEWTVDADRRRVIGVAEDLGTFSFTVAA